MKMHVPKVASETPDQRSELIQKLRDAAPEAFTEGRLDPDKLNTLVGDTVPAGPERYTFTWAGKRDALAMLQVPTAASLVPSVANSISFDAAQHAFIEGENLEVLKILYRSYFGHRQDGGRRVRAPGCGGGSPLADL